jgi:hypothetical protein
VGGSNFTSVSIIYLVGGDLQIDSTPLAQAGHYDDFRTHARSHVDYWAELLKYEKVPNTEYEEFPTGRVAYDAKSGKFGLLADKCILNRKGVVAEIFAQLGVPVKDSEGGLDSHNRYFERLRRGH